MRGIYPDIHIFVQEERKDGKKLVPYFYGRTFWEKLSPTDKRLYQRGKMYKEDYKKISRELAV